MSWSATRSPQARQPGTTCGSSRPSLLAREFPWGKSLLVRAWRGGQWPTRENRNTLSASQRGASGPRVTPGHSPLRAVRTAWRQSGSSLAPGSPVVESLGVEGAFQVWKRCRRWLKAHLAATARVRESQRFSVEQPRNPRDLAHSGPRWPNCAQAVRSANRGERPD